ncbi:uncharacterized protein [Physcomitrium patens]|uniref:uncharacterized protein isoform X2 n=1 Tax=Physcomitrium patens TaxID=3218 RepID=UPI003CCCF840
MRHVKSESVAGRVSSGTTMQHGAAARSPAGMDAMDEGGMATWGGGVGCAGEERRAANCSEMRAGATSTAAAAEHPSSGGHGSRKQAWQGGARRSKGGG